MRVVFFGTPEFAIPSLRSLVWEGHDIAAVVTQPDRPHGRSRSVLVPPPIKAFALEESIPVFQPERPTGDVFLASLHRLKADVGVVVAYGHILSPVILELPRLGMLNVHASLLPRWRGAAPIQHAILAGDPASGVSIMQMDAGMDTGPVHTRVETPIAPRETAGELAARLADLGAAALVSTLEALTTGAVHPEPQDEALATHAPKIHRDQARIAWRESAEAVARQTRAFDPAPGAWTEHAGRPLKLFGGTPVAGEGAPGIVLDHTERLVVACGAGAVQIAEVQPAGKRRLAVEDWIHGQNLGDPVPFS
jgi:methionyl-tRNA formyltransferase